MRHRLLGGLVLVALSMPGLAARGGFLTENYPNAGFNSGGGNAVIGKHHSGDIFGDGTTARKYEVDLQPFAPTALPNITAMLTNIFAGPDDFGHKFGDKFSLVQMAFQGNNELTVKSYSTFASTGGLVGADMYVSYTKDAAKDPAAASIHWLQVITDTWSIVTGTGKPGVTEKLVDVKKASNSPFYDNSYDANFGSTYLFDRPSRSSTDLATYNGAFPLTWTAQTFAVVDTGVNDANGKDILNVFGGFQWGWQVITPEPSTLGMGFSGLVILVAASVRRRASRPTAGSEE